MCSGHDLIVPLEHPGLLGQCSRCPDTIGHLQSAVVLNAVFSGGLFVGTIPNLVTANRAVDILHLRDAFDERLNAHWKSACARAFAKVEGGSGWPKC